MENRDAKSGAETEDEGSSGFGMQNSGFGITDVYREGFTDRKTREGDKKGFPQNNKRRRFRVRFMVVQFLGTVKRTVTGSGSEPKRGCSSVGRAPALQAGGHGFESHHLHQWG